MLSFDEQQQIIWRKELDDYVRQVFFTNQGEVIIATTSTGTAWAFTTGDASCIFSRKLHNGAIIACCISQQYRLLATGGEDGIFLMTSIESGDTIYKFDAKGKWIEHVIPSPNGKYVAFAFDKTVIIITSAGEVYDTLKLSSNTISALSWHNDSDTLCIGSFGGVHLYSICKKEDFQFLALKNAVVSLTISPDKEYVCCGTQDYQVHIWPLPYEPGADLYMHGFPTKVKYLSWHFHGFLLATNSGKQVIVWDFSGSGPVNRPPRMLEGHFRTVKAISFQNNDDVLVSGDEGGLILFFCPMEDSVTDFVVNVDQEITTLTWSPNDRFVLAGTAAGDIILIKCPIIPKHGLRATQN